MDDNATKRRAVAERIASIERSIVRALEYLESGKHAHWERFRARFVPKWKDGREAPPHRDWVEHVFLRRLRRSLDRSERLLERLETRRPFRSERGHASAG